MLIKLGDLIKKYKIHINGVMHIGAHLGEEYDDYKKAGIKKIVWVEGNPSICEQLKKIVPDIVINELISDKEDEVDFYITNNGQSSSILKFGLHSKYHPQVKVNNTLKLKTKRIDNIYSEYKLDSESYDFLNLDIQGMELSALKSMGDYLTKYKYIYTEVNEDYVYQGNALISELDAYLKTYGFYRVETKMTPYKWGDAFYIKK